MAGPDEELPRDMAHFEFICHAPSDYFKHSRQYHSQHVDSRLLGCVWTTLGASIECVDAGGDEQTLRGQSAYVENHVIQNSEQSRSTSSFREKTRSHKAGFTRPKDRLIR